MEQHPHKVVVIGAGIGGLSAALRLAHAGSAVTVLEQHDGPGGKMRTLPSVAGPVDAGPTVLTMRKVFVDLFADVGERLEDQLTLQPLATLARHYWDDGTRLDLMADPAESEANIKAVFGHKAAAAFVKFSARAARLFTAFDAPMMQADTPSQAELSGLVLRNPALLADMAPHRSLAGLLRHHFREPKLAQLFGRYATYVGGSPYLSPAILSLVWSAEAQGVWAVDGGMHKLAHVIEALSVARGATFRYGNAVRRIVRQGGKVAGVETRTGFIAADVVLFNGDPRALATGLLGDGLRTTVATHATEPRSLSAYVQAFAARPKGVDLAHHTIFFGRDPGSEFRQLAKGQMPDDPTLYVCAQDHGTVASDAVQRFEIIMNAPPVHPHQDEDKAQCQTLIFNRLAACGLTFDRIPGQDTLTTPLGFDGLFPASLGSLYGRSPHGLMAAFKRPTARTAIAGLYLCGGGAHPGAGVPMATLSGRHAAAAILSDQISTSTSQPTAMRGGTLTGAAPAAPKQSQS